MRTRLCTMLVVTALVLGNTTRADESTVAESLIPFDALTVSNRFLVRGVTDHYTLRREYSAQRFTGRAEIFEYLLENMEVSCALAQQTGLISYRATRDSQGRLFADDTRGAAGFLLPVYSRNGKHAFYVEGTQRGVFLVRGRGVAIVDYRPASTAQLEYTGGIFVKVDNAVLAALAQLFSIFLRGTVDSHFQHVIRHPILLTTKAAEDPEGLLKQIGLMPEVDQKLMAPFAELLRTPTNADKVTSVSP